MSVAVPGLGAALAGLLDPVEIFRAAFGMEPFDWQYSYLRETHNTVLLKGRQIGASTSTASLAIRHCKYISNTLAAIISPSLKQSTEVTVKARQGLQRMGEKLIQDSASVLGLANGSRIMSLPGTPRSVRGWTAGLLILDEAAFLDPMTILAARALVATGGRVIVQSTPAGPYGPFFDLFSSTEPGWAKYRVRSDAAPSITKEFLATERASLSDEEYAQEYEAEFSTPGLGLIDPVRLRELTNEPTEKAESSVWDKMRDAQ